MPIRPLLLLPAATGLAGPVSAQRPRAVAVDSGAWILHKIGNAIERQEWRDSARPDGVRRLTTRFAFTDRGTEVALDAVLERAPDRRPLRFTVAGRTSRFSSIDLAVNVTGDTVVVRLDTVEQRVPLGAAVAAHGYAPVAVQQLLGREWLARARPASGAARATGLERESGTLRPGMRGDVVVVAGDPFTDIGALRRIRPVVAGGGALELAPLWRSVGFTP